MNSASAASRTAAEDFRAVMAQVPASVAVVTTFADGVPHGTTVSAFMSISVDPPTLLVSLGNTSSLLSKLAPGSQLGVNVLTLHQADVAAHFARKDKDSTQVEWELPDGEPPRLPGSLAWIALTITELIAVKDHTLVIGTVDTARAAAGPPLLYRQRTYGTHAPATPPAPSWHSPSRERS